MKIGRSSGHTPRAVPSRIYSARRRMSLPFAAVWQAAWIIRGNNSRNHLKIYTLLIIFGLFFFFKTRGGPPGPWHFCVGGVGQCLIRSGCTRDHCTFKRWCTRAWHASRGASGCPGGGGAGNGRLGLRCDENLVPAGAPSDPDGREGFSPEWCTMLAHPGEFDGYAISEAALPTAEAFGFRPSVNLYGTRGVVYVRARHSGTSHYDPLDEVDRRTLLFAAVGEMLRYDDPEYQGYIRGITGRMGSFTSAFLFARCRFSANNCRPPSMWSR